MTQPPTGTRVSIFGIIVVGLIGGLIVGLLVNSTFTLEGFFLGFAGGALITVGAYFFATMKSPPQK